MYGNFEALTPAAQDKSGGVGSTLSQDRGSLLLRLRNIAYAPPATLSAAQLLQLLDIAAEAEQTLAQQQERIRYLENLSITDELTGLLNRRGFDQELGRALSRARRNGEDGALILCDMNYFKSINDTYGHLAGDTVLRAVGRTLVEHSRKSDYCARLSGDEFAILLPQLSATTTHRVLRKLDGLLNTLTVRWNSHEIPVSLSFGHAHYDARSTPQQLLHEADQAMYRSKDSRKVTYLPKKKGS